MKRKELQEFADKEMRSMTNEEMKRNLLAEQARLSEDKPKAKSKRWTPVQRRAVAFALCLTVIIAVVVPCAVILPRELADESLSIPNYSYTDEIDVPATIDDVNAVLEGYRIASDNVQTVTTVVDSVSGDGLYYKISWEAQDGSAGCNLLVVFNTDYEPLDFIADEQIRAAGLNLECYFEEQYDEESGAYFYTGEAKTVIGKVRVFIKNYSCITMMADNGLSDMIEQTFIRK